jgi:F0F1-type ATP synthase membrane subunit c/vacuolar-type H+-ATPase subunit K
MIVNKKIKTKRIKNKIIKNKRIKNKRIKNKRIKNKKTRNIHNNIILIGGGWLDFFICGSSKCDKEEEDPEPQYPTDIENKDYDKKFNAWQKQHNAWLERQDSKTKKMMTIAINDINNVSAALGKQIQQSDTTLDEELLELELLELEFESSNNTGGGLCGSKIPKNQENQETERQPCKTPENIIIYLFKEITNLSAQKKKIETDIEKLQSEIKNTKINKKIRINKLRLKKIKEGQIKVIRKLQIDKLKIIKTTAIAFNLNQKELHTKSKYITGGFLFLLPDAINPVNIVGNIAADVGKFAVQSVLPKFLSDKLTMIIDLLKDAGPLRSKLVGTPPFFTDGAIVPFCTKDGLFSDSTMFCAGIAVDIIQLAISAGATAPSLIMGIASDPEQIIKFMTTGILPAIISEAEEGRTSYLTTMNASLGLIFGPGMTAHKMQSMTLGDIIDQFNFFQEDVVAPQPVAIPQTVQPVMIPQTLQPAMIPQTLQPVMIPQPVQPVMIPQTLQPVMIPQTLQPVMIPQPVQGGGGNKKIRKHKGIQQTGGSAGKLKKGYKYSGKRLKNGKAEIIKIKKSKIVKRR